MAPHQRGCDSSAHRPPGCLPSQARRFLEEGHMLRLVVTFKGGSQIALGRDVTLYLIGQLAGRYCWLLVLLVLPAAGTAPGIACPGALLRFWSDPCVWPAQLCSLQQAIIPCALCASCPLPLGPFMPAGLAKVRDEKQLQRPMRGHWAVQLQPLLPAVETPAKAPPPKKPAQQQQQKQEQQAAHPPPAPDAAAVAGAAG